MRVHAVLACFATVLIAGCVSAFFVTDVDQVVKSSPVLEPLSAQRFERRTPPESIALYYKGWTALTVPNAIKDWKYHFVIGEASSPSWPYQELVKVTVARYAREDEPALADLKRVAASQGGDALIDLRREPMLEPRDGNSITLTKQGARILGYRYFGTVVRKL